MNCPYNAFCLGYVVGFCKGGDGSDLWQGVASILTALRGVKYKAKVKAPGRLVVQHVLK